MICIDRFFVFQACTDGIRALIGTEEAPLPKAYSSVRHSQKEAQSLRTKPRGNQPSVLI